MAETLHEMAVRMVGDRCTLECASCPAKALWDKNDICLIRLVLKAENCEEQIEGLKAWAKEHPAQRYPTWREWQERMFPFRDRNISPCEFDDSSRFNCKAKSCGQCMNESIPADIAEKLGIKPITTAKAVPEHDGCKGCRWTDAYDDLEPCKNCYGVRGGSAPDLWEDYHEQ